MNKIYLKSDGHSSESCTEKEFFEAKNRGTVKLLNKQHHLPKGYDGDCYILGYTYYFCLFPEDLSDIVRLKTKNRPENKEFFEKPYERLCEKRKRTRPWDNCWFSNKPHIINLTVEQAIKQHPKYMLWCYENLKHIQWSVFTVKMFEDLKKSISSRSEILSLL